MKPLFFFFRLGASGSFTVGFLSLPVGCSLV